ncbi:MAG TPA: CDGSH iron-sulfur domain-containing protein [Bacteroidales bacterium]|jgi:CDGSH-type Zn-finger protein|nr:CDGSH iron-sulfur domain-containing protein [Bacteroidales bacterium]
MEEKREDRQRVTVEVVEGGPLRITGNFVVKDLKRNREEAPFTVDLCRCGNTADKPYCDNTCKHRH